MTQISTTATSLQLMQTLQLSTSQSESSGAQKTSSQVGSSTDAASISGEAHTLILKDRLSETSQMMALITISGDALGDLSEYLLEIKTTLGAMSPLDPSSQSFADLKTALLQTEAEMSEFVGSLFHSNTFDITLHTGGSVDEYTYFETTELIDGNGDTGTIAAVEIDFKTVIASAHNPETCSHCAQSTAPLSTPSASETPLNTGATITSSTAGFNTLTGSSGSNQGIIDTMLLGTSWDIDASAGETLTYSYYDAATAGYDSNYNAGSGLPVANGPSAMNSINSSNETNLNTMFQRWDDVLDIDFSEVDESGGSDSVGELRVAFTDQSSSAAAFAYQPGGSSVNGDIWFELEDNSAFDPDGVGTHGYSFKTALHEVGHAIGLSHPFDQSSITGDTLSDADDIQRNTFMSYTNIDRNMMLTLNETVAGVTTAYTMDELQTWTQTSGSSLSFSTISVSASTPMPYDILAAQYLYGAATDTRTEDTNYAFDQTPQTMQTIYDSDGIDTLDASNQVNASTINLMAGSFSSIGTYSVAQQMALLDSKGLNAGDTVQSWLSTAFDGLSSATSANMDIHSVLYTGADNVAIAYGVTIENAYGGSGDDTITGNAENNYIIGNGGNDTIDGSTGDADIFVLSGDLDDYSISTTGGVTTIVDNTSSRDGTDTLTNVEYLEFTETSPLAGFARMTATSLQNFTSDVTFDINVDGTTNTVTLAAKDYTGSSFATLASDLDTAIDTAFGSDVVTVTANSPIIITSNSTGTSSEIALSNITDTTLQSAFGVSDAQGTGLELEDGQAANSTQYYALADGSVSSIAPAGTAGAGSGGSGGSSGSSSSTLSSSDDIVYAGSIGSIDLSTREGATAAIDIVARALEQINSVRSKLGAIENRLDHAITNMGEQMVNTSASKSRIEDADFAVEMSRLIKAQVLQQAASQLLGRANSQPQSVMTLLR